MQIQMLLEAIKVQNVYNLSAYSTYSIKILPLHLIFIELLVVMVITFKIFALPRFLNGIFVIYRRQHISQSRDKDKKITKKCLWYNCKCCTLFSFSYFVFPCEQVMGNG